MAEDGRQLIRQAFEQARLSGKPDWYRMTSAVLKNRLLDLTGNTFHESDYGAHSFSMFLSRFNDLVSVDKSRSPSIVELQDQKTATSVSRRATTTFSRPRIRSDLWRAVLDYSSGIKYVWDTTSRQARPSHPEDLDPTIPTITQAIHGQWQAEFAEQVPTTADSAQVNSWIQNHLSTSHLPEHLIPQWNEFLRNQVHNHLLAWFSEAELQPPSDLILFVSGRSAQTTSDSEALRRLILQTVSEMSETELVQVNLPARAVLRAVKPRR